MSADRQPRRTPACLAVAASLLAAGALAQEGAPDAEFLEYLGAWEASDEDWMIFTDAAETDDGETTAGDGSGDDRPTADADDSTESEDEA